MPLAGRIVDAGFEFAIAAVAYHDIAAADRTDLTGLFRLFLLHLFIGGID